LRCLSASRSPVLLVRYGSSQSLQAHCAGEIRTYTEAWSELAQDLIQRLIVRRQANRSGWLSRGDMDIRDHVVQYHVDKLLKPIPPPWVRIGILSTRSFRFMPSSRMNLFQPSRRCPLLSKLCSGLLKMLYKATSCDRADVAVLIRQCIFVREQMN
jgi:hypothetical protein